MTRDPENIWVDTGQRHDYLKLIGTKVDRLVEPDIAFTLGAHKNMAFTGNGNPISRNNIERGAHERKVE
jgi:hypothetical protein